MNRGVDVSHWFSRECIGSFYAPHGRRDHTRRRLRHREAGASDHVRLSISATPLEQYPRGADDLAIAGSSPLLDSALDTILADGMAVQVDLHPEEPYQAGNSHQQHIGGSASCSCSATYALRIITPMRMPTRFLRDHERAEGIRWAGVAARVAAAVEAAPHHTDDRRASCSTLSICSRNILCRMAT